MIKGGVGTVGVSYACYVCMYAAAGMSSSALRARFEITRLWGYSMSVAGGVASIISEQMDLDGRRSG